MVVLTGVVEVVVVVAVALVTIAMHIMANVRWTLVEGGESMAMAIFFFNVVLLLFDAFSNCYNISFDISSTAVLRDTNLSLK